MGMSDLTGWTTVTDSGSGAHYAAYTAIEVKSKRGRPTPEQSAFLDAVRRAGGRAGIARSVEDAGRIISGEAQ
jgi:hypothetical protein